jgi:hypothetical protein
MKATPKIAMMSPTSVTRLFPRQHSRSVGKSVNDGQAVETFPQPLGKVPFPLLLRHTPRFRDLLRGHGRDQHVVNQGGPISPEFGLLSRIAQLDQRTVLPDQCLHSAEADVRPPRRKSGFDRCCRKRSLRSRANSDSCLRGVRRVGDDGTAGPRSAAALLRI